MTPPEPHTAHLNEHEIETLLLLPPADAAPGTHLATCGPCQARLTTERHLLTHALAAFNHATLQSAQARSSTLPVALSRPKSAFGSAAWAYGATFAAAIGLATGAGNYRQPNHIASQIAGDQPAATQPQPTEIDQDNALLFNIGKALDAPIASPASLFHTPPDTLGQ